MASFIREKLIEEVYAYILFQTVFTWLFQLQVRRALNRASAEKKITQVCFVAIMARWGEKEEEGWFWQNRAGPVCW